MFGMLKTPGRIKYSAVCCAAALSLSACASGSGSGAGAASYGGNAAVNLFSQTCLAEIGNFDLAEQRFAALGLTPLGTDFVDSDNNLIGAIARSKDGCSVIHTNRATAGYTKAEVNAFSAALGLRPAPGAPLSSNKPGGLPFYPIRANGAQYIPIMQAFGSPAEGNARLLYGLLAR